MEIINPITQVHYIRMLFLIKEKR